MNRPCIDGALIRGAKITVEKLSAAKLTVVTAESCTAGLVAAAMAEVEGAGAVLHGGFVTFTKANKAAALGVSPALLAREGSVTARVAEALARGALERTPADLALGITGVLGPDKDDDGNPVGKVYLCCCRRAGGATTLERNYGGHEHRELQRMVVCEALRLIAAAVDGL